MRPPAGHRLPLPSLTGSITLVEWLIVLGGWLILDLASAGPLGQNLAKQGVIVSHDHLLVAQAIDWALWAALLSLTFRELDRYPLRRGRRIKHLLRWALIAVTVAAVHAALTIPLVHTAARLLGVDPHVLAFPGLSFPALWVDDLENFGFVLTAYFFLQFVHRARLERRRAADIERSLRTAKLHALTLELQPHFLFNTLNGIAALVRSNPATAERMLVSLSDLLRVTLDSGGTAELTLEEELQRLGLYITLQQMRLGHRLSFGIDVPADLMAARVPAMLLQPLVENSLTHGLGGRRGNGTVVMRGRANGDSLLLSVEDDGVGVPAGQPIREGTGLGNTRERLAVLYPHGSALRLEPIAAGGTRVTVTLPMRLTSMMDEESP